MPPSNGVHMLRMGMTTVPSDEGTSESLTKGGR